MYAIEYYTGIPIAYEPFLLEKYDCFITSCCYIDAFFPTHEVNYMLFREDGQLKELIAYGIKGNTVICFNSLTKLDESIISLSIDKIFERHPFVKKIKIDASYTKLFFKKSILYYESDDYILDLPESMDEYYKSLGTSTRQHVKNRKVRLFRDYPNAKLVVKYNEEIDWDLMLRIMDLSKERRLQKGSLRWKDTQYYKQLLICLKQYGIAVCIELDGKIIAANITSIAKNSIFGHVMAHDINFSKYSLGEICAVHVIQTAIENNFTSFHFLWGKSDLKTRLLSKKSLLYSYIVFRRLGIDYFLTKIKAVFLLSITKLKQSTLLKPFKVALKIYKRNQNIKIT